MNEEKVGAMVPDEDVQVVDNAMLLINGRQQAIRQGLEAVYPIWRRRELALREVVAEQQLDNLRRQLPRGMEGCTILFKECEKGHGWLTATNWVQHGCPTCRAERAEQQLDQLKEAFNHRGNAIRSMEDDYRELKGRLDAAMGKVDAARDVLGMAE